MFEAMCAVKTKIKFKKLIYTFAYNSRGRLSMLWYLFLAALNQ